MNSSFDSPPGPPRRARSVRLLLLLALLAAPRPARALSVHAVYRTACSREIGVILRVEKRDIHLLRLDGKLVKIPRHEIVSLLYYPLSQLPLAQVPSPPGFPPLRVQTRYEGQLADLVSGWPIDYSESQVSFLLQSGKELVIDRNSIWSLTFDAGVAPAPVAAVSPTEPVVFVHPQTSGFCVEKTPPAANARPIFAQQILNDQIVIRRELDRLLEGYEQIVEYDQDQKFYPVPFLYHDRTMLGIWVSLLSRYGASGARSNNFTPLLVDELALGPFRYQHVFLSGAAPNEMFLHHEAQSQLFYRFKAAYFHTSVFFDPNLLLVGTKYQWRDSDLEDESYDDRLNETLAIEFGFDWGPLAVELSPAVLGQGAVKAGDFFDSYGGLSLWRVGLRATFPAVRLQAFGGRSTSSDGTEREMVVGGLPQPVFYDTRWRYDYWRVNVGVPILRQLDVSFSGILRGLEYTANPDTSGVEEVRYESSSLSIAAQASWALSHRFSVGGHAIVEYQGRKTSASDPGSRVLPRFGLFTGFWF